MRIEIWSDLVCPWCYIGKRRLEEALTIFPHREEVEVLHRAFQLNPLFTGPPSSRREMLKAKYDWSEAEAERRDVALAQTAAASGLEYRLSPAGLTGNTRDAHRLVHLAHDRQRQDAVVERFFRGYIPNHNRLLLFRYGNCRSTRGHSAYNPAGACEGIHA
jgi:predicted DsbA family dithiol-disulfide isomerase